MAPGQTFASISILQYDHNEQLAYIFNHHSCLGEVIPYNVCWDHYHLHYKNFFLADILFILFLYTVLLFLKTVQIKQTEVC